MRVYKCFDFIAFVSFVTDMPLPLEGRVSTMFVTLSKWKSDTQTGGSTGTVEENVSPDLCGSTLSLPFLLQMCFI